MENKILETPTRPARIFLPENFVVESWIDLEKYFEDLKNRNIASEKELEKWMIDRSELDAILEEDMAWRYIRMNIDTTDEKLTSAFNFFVQEIQPKMAPYENFFNKKLVESSFLKQLDQDKYFVYLREIKKDIEIFREKNIPIFTEMQTEQQKYGSISSLMTVNIDGQEMTLQKASNFLKDLDRSKREEAYKKIKLRRLADVDKLNKLYNHLVGLRNQVALNAGFENYVTYTFVSKGRFDYGIADCEQFHASIAGEIVPILNQFDLERKHALNLNSLKPWDTEVDISGKPPLKPFETGQELIEKTITCFKRIRPFFGECLELMRDMGHLDLESKKGKAPGGFNYPLYEIGYPFIYMNSVGSFRDLVTMVHEGGHAIHSVLTKDLELTAFKSFPSEVAELASMSMELISMDHWDVFFDDKESLKRAKREQLEKVLQTLPWVATIDKFQHWVYNNPNHNSEQRTKAWIEIYDQFGSKVIDWSGEEAAKANLWQKQLHLYEVPFYYIEYGFAQLGAIAVWRNYKNNPQKALDQYQDALSLGYTKTLGEIYQTAGIKFDFNRAYVKELADFVKEELIKIGH